MSKWVPYQPNTIFMNPVGGDGFTQAGLYVAYDTRLPKILGEVTAVQEGETEILEGDTILYRPFNHEEIMDASRNKFSVIHKDAINGVMLDYEAPKE